MSHPIFCLARKTFKFALLFIYIVKEFSCKSVAVLFLYHENLWFWTSFAPIAKFSKKITQKWDFLAHFKRCTWTKWAQDKDNTSSLFAVIESFLTCFHFYIFGWKVEKFGVFFEKSDMRKDALFNFNLKFQTQFSFYSAFSNEKKELWVHTFTQENNRSHIYCNFEYFFTFFLWDNSQSLTLNISIIFFLVIFRIGAKKRSKWRFRYDYNDRTASFTLKLQHYLYGQ